MNYLELLKEYHEKFGNLDEVKHPAFEHDPRFAELLAAAIARGRALDRHDVEEVMGDPGWEW